MAEEPNDVSYKNNKHIQRISIQKTSKDVAVWPNGRVSILDVKDSLLLNVVSRLSMRLLRTHTTKEIRGR